MLPMIETLFLFIGLGFSVFVYFRSIRPRKDPAAKKTLYFLLTLIGITGIVFLVGVMVADMLIGAKPAH